MRTRSMRELRILSLTRRRRQKGQMAIFVVLIFQVLFVFFAMALNVALVVHDKINLQNSADLAALYGAQKQAEVLNVLAHINFQMRQNFKLLTWRYRILGSITYGGDLRNPPPGYSGYPSFPGDHWCPYAVRPGGPPGQPFIGSYNSCKPSYTSSSMLPACDPATHNYPVGYCDANYFVCISASIWLRSTSIDTNTNHCGHLSQILQPITPFINLPGPLETLTGGLLTQHVALGTALNMKCEEEGFYNWLITQMFLGHFRLDQKDRKVMIREIYNRTLQLGSDLDGNSIEEGVRRTFQKNLTYTNKTNLEPSANPVFQFFDSPRAGGEGFKDFFTPIHIFPILEYLDFPSASGSTCSDAKRAPHYRLPKKGISLSSSPELKNFVTAWRWLFDISTDPNTRDPATSPAPPPSQPPPIFFPPDQDGLLYPLTLGYERTDEIFYYGVSAKVNYKSAFPLFFPGLTSGDLQLTASAVAKPFGGRMGSKKAELDPRIKPILIETGNTKLTSGNPFLLKPNYSRYPGDEWGLIHKEAHEQYYLKKPYSPGSGSLGTPTVAPYDIMHFSHLYGSDPLAYNSGEEEFLFVRMMELMAVAPDLYDMTYYSPLNHYMTAYFPRICHLFDKASDCESNSRAVLIGNVSGDAGPVKAFLRGDFGFPYTKVYSDENKRSSLGGSSPLSPFYFNLGTTGFSVLHLGGKEDKYINRRVAPWLVKDPAHFLTAWVPVTAKERYEDYVFPDQIFGKCRAVAEEGQPVPSGCVTGGRAGHSVKLISCEMAKKALSPAPPSYICP